MHSSRQRLAYMEGSLCIVEIVCMGTGFIHKVLGTTIDTMDALYELFIYKDLLIWRAVCVVHGDCVHGNWFYS